VKIKAKYVRDKDDNIIGWDVPCRDCGIIVRFYKPSKRSKFVPNANARCEECYERRLPEFSLKKLGK